MTSPASAQDYLELPPLKRQGGTSGRVVALAALLVIAVMSVGIIFLEFSVRDKRSELLHNAELRLKLSADARAAVLAEWLKGRLSLAESITASDIFLLFATEVDLAGSETVLKGALGEQLPYMQAAVAAFAKQAGLAGVYLINRQGRAYITSSEAPSLSESQRAAAKALFPSGRPVVLPLKVGKKGLKLDILLPLHPPQSSESSEGGRTIGVVLMSIWADARIADALAANALDATGERAHLLQLTGDKLVEANPAAERRLTAVAAELTAALEPIAFANRVGVGSAELVYSVGVVVPRAPWILIEEIDESDVLAPLRGHRIFGGIIAGLATVGFVAAAMAFWWRQGSESNRMMAHQYHEFASRIQTQRQLLDSINGSIQEQITVKDRDGTYIYVNPSFAKTAGLPVGSIVGLKDQALFDAQVAETTSRLDAQVLEKDQRVDRNLLVDMGQGERYLQISKSPFQDEEGRTIGVVSVARDVTELMEAQQRRDQAVMNTIRALSNTVEAVDPHLSGHSHKLERLCTALAGHLECSEAEIATLEIAANLSQIGKLSVPSRILTKAERLSTEEQQIMQGHIDHADRILSELDFGLPVRDVVVQMHERLDGSGYPAGLSGEEMTLSGRILAVADVFVARTAPRSYREGISAEDVVALLEQNTTRYDVNVIGALKELMLGSGGAVVDLEGDDEA